MSIRTLQTAEHNGLEVSEIEVTDEDGRRIRWDAYCPACDELVAVGVTEDDAFETAEAHRHEKQAGV